MSTRRPPTPADAPEEIAAPKNAPAPSAAAAISPSDSDAGKTPAPDTSTPGGVKPTIEEDEDDSDLEDGIAGIAPDESPVPTELELDEQDAIDADAILASVDKIRRVVADFPETTPGETIVFGRANDRVTLSDLRNIILFADVAD